ncbi:MAG: T9SS type A sorting domain-containing protein, partial [Candidatus Cloacimonetes bacterium]|nr:T9SS type A sorting domain-containing protein [Candidatus Cloacimonadota bacterium]
NWGDNAIVQVLNLDFNNLRNYSTGLMPTDIKLQPGSSSNADPAQIQIPAIAVYPSPLRSGHSLNVKSLDNQRGEFKLFNLRGQMLHSVQLQPAEQISLDIKLNNGIYFYRFQSGTASTTGKLTVIR